MIGGKQSAALRMKIEVALAATMLRVDRATALPEHTRNLEEVDHALRDFAQTVWTEVVADSLPTVLALAREVEQLRRDVAELRGDEGAFIYGRVAEEKKDG